ncbi:hypothetical protein KIH39_14105 [Telmatocola sphagniphila]|uniref:Uncharacterized protein n=1 Tax=Telmatocola sphagniphila TaxID=1123043 RepID=A0A8E6B1D8_9BACT|nr:hypothetical protein [Telmatocola sphagniphila]QVL29998.1 hypothetical protein KIH39_14105 [Telmatocola sphagniphila]
MISFKNSVVAVFAINDQAKKSTRELQKYGFDMKKMAIVGKHYQTEEHSKKAIKAS